VTRILHYLGNMTTTAGTVVAMVRVRDPDSGESATAFLPRGAVTEGVRIREISENGLCVVDGLHKEHRLVVGERVVVEIE
jgi:hypothetical protein